MSAQTRATVSGRIGTPVSGQMKTGGGIYGDGQTYETTWDSGWDGYQHGSGDYSGNYDQG